jgi:hypothetical protein
MTSPINASYVDAQKPSINATISDAPEMRTIFLSESGIKDAMKASCFCFVVFMILSSLFRKLDVFVFWVSANQLPRERSINLPNGNTSE